MAATAFDAQILVDDRLGDVVEIEILPIRDIRHSLADNLLNVGKALFVHIVGQTVDHVFDNLEAIGHGGWADLNIATAKRQKFRRIAPSGDAANTGNRQTRCFGIGGDFRHHVQRNRFDRRAAITTMGSLAVNRRLRRKCVEIDAHDRGYGVDQRHGVSTAIVRRASRASYIRDIRRQLHNHRHVRVLLAPACHHFHIFGNLADSGPHAAL